MTVRYLTDENGRTTDVQLPLNDYLDLLERANAYPQHVREGVERAFAQVSDTKLKSTSEVLRKYKK